MFDKVFKRFERSMKVSWREQPTSQDVAAIRDHRDRLALVIKSRWQIIAVLIAFAVGLLVLFWGKVPFSSMFTYGLPSMLALAFLIACNTLYQLTYRRLANLAFLNWAQLLVDMVFAAILVYFSGGASSLLWPLMLLFIIEGAVIIGPYGAWGLAVVGFSLLAIIASGEMVGLFPQVVAPFGVRVFEPDSRTYIVILTWQAAVLFGMALTSNSLLRLLGRTTRAVRPNSVIDEPTGLFSQQHFFKMVDIELGRAGRFGQAAHLLVLDIDDFGQFNKQFGIDAGDEIIKRIADSLVDEVRHAGGRDGSSNLVARLGGEEFAILYSEALESEEAPDAEDAAILAESIRSTIERIRVDDVGVTVSIGIASFPDDGMELDHLRNEADAALARAVSFGGNRIQQSGAFSNLADDDEFVPFFDSSEHE